VTTPDSWDNIIQGSTPSEPAAAPAAAVGRGSRRADAVADHAPKEKKKFWNYPRRGKGPVMRWLPSWKFVLGCFVGLLVIAGGVFAAAWFTTPIPQNLDAVNDQQTTIYYSDGKTEIGSLFLEKRILIENGDLPEYVGNAVVASEDSTFWTNSGVDLRGIARALVNNLRGGPRQGASTLTQQYVERYYTDTTTSYAGKAKEAILAVKINRELSKDDILTGYLNTIYWGRGAYGIEAASQAYYGHSAKDMTISEAAMLAGIIPSPSRWDPAIDLEQAQARWDRTLTRMVDGGFITAADKSAATFPEFLPKPEATNTKGGQAGFLMNEVTRELTKAGGPYADKPEALETDGLIIITSIDKKLQKEAVKVAKEIPRGDDPHPAAEGLRMGLVSIDPKNGEILALYGGDDYIKEQFNFATDGRYQPGSTFKPFTLIAALEQGHSLYETFNGSSPQTFAVPGSKPWRVSNFAGESYGAINLYKATADSVNTVYAKLNIEVGPASTVDVAHTLGIPDVPEGHPGFLLDNPANVLGTDTLRPYDMASAYATIANDGAKTTPHLVRSITSLQGDALYNGPTEVQQVIDPNVVACAIDAMKGVINTGSGVTASQVRGPNGEKRDIAGKTGTAQDNKAASFIAFTPQMVTLVALHQDAADGNGEESITGFGQWAYMRNGMTGGTFPATAWKDFMQVALDGVEVEKFPTCDLSKINASPSPGASFTGIPSEAPSESPSEEPSPSQSATPDVKPTQTQEPTQAPVQTQAPTVAPTQTQEPTTPPPPVETQTPDPEPTDTVTPDPEPTDTPTPDPTATEGTRSRNR
jgi:membrane peptidoglycan carboxypeptidase